MALPTVTPSTFYTELDAALTTVGIPYTSGGGSLTVASGAVFGSPSGSHPVRITAQQAGTGNRAHYALTNVSGNVLTVSPIDGYTDINLSVGDQVAQTDSAEGMADLQAAILAAQVAIDEHATLAAPLASPTFSGTITLASYTGILKGAAGVVTVAINGTDYLAPTGNGSGLTGLLGSQVAGNIAGNAASITGSISGSQVTGLVAELATLATLASPSFTGPVTIDALTGLLKGTAGLVSPATAGTDYISPSVATQFTAQQNFAIQALTDGATIAWDLAAQQVASVTLAGNATLANPSNMVDGGTYILSVTQDGTGSRALAFGTGYVWPGASAPTLSPAPGAVDVLTFVCNGTVMRGAISKGYPS